MTGYRYLRFGDDQYGRRPFDAERVVARYRVGNGQIGNVGWGTLVHLVDPGVVVIPPITRIWQPLPANGGVEPETIEHVRQIAPEAFRAIQFRAVTERDWEEMALRHPDVAAAKASFRWTGSWHTVFVAIHPVDAANLHRLPGGGTELTAGFRARDQGASHPLQARGLRSQHPRRDLCAARNRHPRSASATAISAAMFWRRFERVLSNRAFADGTTGLLLPAALRLRREPSISPSSMPR